jgi:hypothetical protein
MLVTLTRPRRNAQRSRGRDFESPAPISAPARVMTATAKTADLGLASGLGRFARYRRYGRLTGERRAHDLAARPGNAADRVPPGRLLGGGGRVIGARATKGLLLRVATWALMASGQRANTASVHHSFQICATSPAFVSYGVLREVPRHRAYGPPAPLKAWPAVRADQRLLVHRWAVITGQITTSGSASIVAASCTGRSAGTV